VPKTVTYNFMPEWAPLVENGLKPHTIRRRRKNPTQPGDTLRLYVGQRTKDCRLLYEEVCAATSWLFFGTEGINISRAKPGPLYYPAGYHRYTGKILHRLAEWDGFDSVADFRAFFCDHYTWHEITFGTLRLIEWHTPERAKWARTQAPAGEE